MIEIQEITYRYPQARENALNGVSLPIVEGAALGLLGPNGAGKTTLMSLLAGLLPVQGGQILFDGVPLGRLPAKERQRISLVPQDFAFYPLLSVWDNMRFFAALYAVRDEGYLKTLLEQAGLAEHRRPEAALKLRHRPHQPPQADFFRRNHRGHRPRIAPLYFG